MFHKHAFLAPNPLRLQSRCCRLIEAWLDVHFDPRKVSPQWGAVPVRRCFWQWLPLLAASHKEAPSSRKGRQD